MDVHKSSLLAVFDSKMRLEVPLFQRQYVWNEEHQWIPLWEDIERKFIESLEGRKDAPTHFLGAMVLDQKQTPTGHVVVRQIIDGQQRLTTLQIFLSAFRDFCREQDCDVLADECDNFIFNRGMMANPDVDKYKVWPTQLDRLQFSDVISSGSYGEVQKKYPLQKKPYARKYDPRPRMVEAYLFFYGQLQIFFLGDEDDPPIVEIPPLSQRLEICFQSLRNALMVVVIDLQADDDPQVIFETLNARGEPLLPADLLRNYIFLRAARADPKSTEALYKKYWSRFDDEFWRQEIKQGRLNRPRSDLYMQHFLSSRQGQDIPIKHLYVEYRHWVEREKPFANITEELSTLANQGDAFRRIVDPKEGDPIYDLATFLDVFDIRTAYPLLLALFDADVSKKDWSEISKILESYLLRRAVCNLTTKNYNRIFLSVTKNLRRDGVSVEKLRSLLLAQSGESVEWPDDGKFKEAWLNNRSYDVLNSPKLIHIFRHLNASYMSTKAEAVFFSEQPTIEHILPQNWEANWLLPDGSKGMEFSELIGAAQDDPRATTTRNRDAVVQTIGNLTILSSGLNSAQSNSAWTKKRPEMMKHSLLPINQALWDAKIWDEKAILERGKTLFEKAAKIWKRG